MREPPKLKTNSKKKLLENLDLASKFHIFALSNDESDLEKKIV